MSTTWHASDGLFALFTQVVLGSVIYTLSLAILAVIARLLIFVPQKLLKLGNEKVNHVWLIYGGFLFVLHTSISLVLCMKNPESMFLAILWSMVILAGLTLGFTLGAALLAGVVTLCYKMS